MMKYNKIAAALAVAASLLSSAAIAGPTPTVATYTLTDALSTGFTDGLVATLTISNSGINTVWTLSTNITAPVASGAFLKELDYTATFGASGHAITNFTAGPGSHVTQGTTPSHANSDVKFVSASGQNRFSMGEVASWTVTNSTVGNFSNFSVLVNNAASGSVQARFGVAAAAPVPEADTYAMLLAGLGLLGFTARRRQASQKLS